jgi:aldehyde dehydrogenase (NAD+)
MKDLINLQRAFFKTGKTRDLDFRLSSLKKLEQVLLKFEPEIVQAFAKDLGKPELEAYTTETAYVMGDLKHALKNLKTWAKPQKIYSPLVLQPAKSEILSEAYGNTLIIAPWNYPYQLALSPLIGAIAAGNTAILKPSEMTPETDKVIQAIIAATFPREYVACVSGGVSETQKLLEEKFDFIFFTGSTRVGQIVMEKAARHLTPVCLELGGKSPCVVDKNIDLMVASHRIIWGKFMNAGQTCVAPDYLYVHEEIYEDFLKNLKATIIQYYGETPRESKSYARIVNEQHFDRLMKMIKQGQVYFGGEGDRKEKFIAPTILTDVTWQDAVMQEEIFGPVLPVLKYKNIDSVIEEINSKGKPLSFYVFSSDKFLQDRLLTECSFGGACVNDCIVHLANPNLPFGGVGESGMGSYHGKSSFEIFTHKKSVLRKPFWGDASMRYPPYTPKKMKLLKFFLG